MMRALGYPRILSLENFRTPNFKLVAELLEWIVHRFDPNSHLPTILDTEQERVVFIKTAVLILLQKARIKLNPKKLYQADGYAVQELAVVVRLLYGTAKQPLDDEGGVAAWNAMRSKVNTKVQEVHECRQLAAQISQTGATLYDLLAKELIAAVSSHRLSSFPFFNSKLEFHLWTSLSLIIMYQLQEARSKALSFSLDLADAEKAIKQAIEAIQGELAQINRNLQNINSDEAALDGKIERKKREYDQQQKRLAKLQSFRPQYMDEYEKYEKKLKQLYAIYVLKFRNVAYLQQLQSEFDKAERQRNAEAEQSMRNMVERVRAEEVALRNTQLGEFDAEEEGEPRPTKKATKVFGSMTGAGLSDEEDDDLEHSDLSDDESERMLSDSRKLKENSFGERDYTNDEKVEENSFGERDYTNDEKVEVSSDDF
uniref:Clusterin-associated protein 1 n=1 Tax=Ascaris lumbricoides TaxID=6252 RepID=A0A9J2PQG5_ASCLU